MPTRVKNKERAERSTRTTKGKKRGEGGKISLREYIKDGEERLETVYVEPAPKAQAPCITLCSVTEEGTDGIEMNLSFLDIDPTSPKASKSPKRAKSPEAEKSPAPKKSEKTRSPSPKKSKSKKLSSEKESKKENKSDDRDESPSKKRFGSPIKLRFTNSTETATADERDERDASCPKRDDSPAKERSSSRLKSKSSYAESFASVTSSIKKKKGRKAKKSKTKKPLKPSTSIDEKSSEEKTVDTNADSKPDSDTITNVDERETKSNVDTVEDEASGSNLDITTTDKSASTDYDHSVTSFEPSIQSSVKSNSKKFSLKKKKADKKNKSTELSQSSSVVSDPNIDAILNDDENDKDIPTQKSSSKSPTEKSPTEKAAPPSPDSVKSGSTKSGMFAYTITELIKGNDMKHAAVKDESDVFAYTVNDLISSPRTNSRIVTADPERDDEVNMLSPISSPRKAENESRTLDLEATKEESAELEIPHLNTENGDDINDKDSEEKIDGNVEKEENDDDEEESVAEKKPKKKFGLFRRSKTKTKKTKTVKQKKTKAVKKKKKDSKKATKEAKKSHEVKAVEEVPTVEEEDPAEAVEEEDPAEVVEEDTKEVIAMVATPEKPEEKEEFLGEEVSLEDTSVQEASVQASSVQSSIVTKDIKKSKLKFTSVFRRGKKSKKVKVPRSPTSKKEKSKKAPSVKKSKKSPSSKKTKSPPQKKIDSFFKPGPTSKSTEPKEEIKPLEEKAVEEPTTAEVVTEETHVEPPKPDEESKADEELADGEGNKIDEPTPTSETPKKSIIDTLADDASKVDSVATHGTSNTTKADSESVVTKGTTSSKKSRTRQLSGKLKKFLSSNASVGGSIASKRGGYSIADTAANSTVKNNVTTAANKSSTLAGRPPLPAVASTTSAEEDNKESLVAAAKAAEETAVTEPVAEANGPIVDEQELVVTSMSVADTLVTSESKAYVERDLRSMGTANVPLPKQTESIDKSNVEQYLDVEDDDKFEYMPDVLFTSFSNSTCDDDKYGACDESVASAGESQQAGVPKGKKVILRNVSDVAGFELDLIDSMGLSKASSMKKNDSELMESVAPSINVAVTDKDAFNPFSIDKGTDGSITEKGAQEAGNSIVPPVDDAEVAQSPSKILDSVEHVLENEEMARSTSKLSLGSKASKASKTSKTSFIGLTSSKLSIGSRASKKSAISDAKSMERGGSKLSLGSKVSNGMERAGSRLSVASKGSKGSKLSKKIDTTSSRISTSSKTSKKSLTKLDTMTPAVIQMDPNLADAVISPLNMQQAEDARNDIVVDSNNSVTKGDESNCGWFGISCQDRFNCFNYQSESIGAEDRDITGEKETPMGETNNIIPADATTDENLSSPTDNEPEEEIVKEDSNVVDHEHKDPLKNSTDEPISNEEMLPTSIEETTKELKVEDATRVNDEELEEKDAMKLNEEELEEKDATKPSGEDVVEDVMKVDGTMGNASPASREGMHLKIDTENLAPANDLVIDNTSPANNSLKSPSKKRSIFKRSLKFASSPAKGFKNKNKEGTPQKPPTHPKQSSPPVLASPKKSISFKKIGSPFKSMTSPRSTPVVNEEDLIDSGVVETAVFAASVVLKKGGPTSTAKSSASVVLISGLKKGKNLPPKLEKNINKDSTVAASVAVDALGSGITQPKVVPLILNTLEAKGYRFTPYKPVPEDQSVLASSITKSGAGGNSLEESKAAATITSNSIASPSTAASAMREQRSIASSTPTPKPANEFVGYRDIMDTVESAELASKESEKITNDNASESFITKDTDYVSKIAGSRRSKNQSESPESSSSSDSVSSESEEPVPRSPRISARRSKSPQRKYNKKPTSPDKNVNIYIMDKDKDNKALSRVLASLNLSQESSSSSSE